MTRKTQRNYFVNNIFFLQLKLKKGFLYLSAEHFSENLQYMQPRLMYSVHLGSSELESQP